MWLVSTAFARPVDIGWVDDTTHPIRCHWERAEDEDRCAEVLTWASLAWDVQVDTIGFSAPMPDTEGGSEALDIYFGVSETSGAGEAWVDCDGGDGSCLDSDPADGMAAAPSYVVIDARLEDEQIPGFVVHEFQHTTQYATDWAEPFLVAWEGTAVSCEMWTLPDVAPSADDVADYQATPWMSAVLMDGYWLWDEFGIDSWYEYGSMVWVRWFDARYGSGDGTAAALLWRTMTQEGKAYEPDVLDAWETIAGRPWQDEFLDFAVDRARMGGPEGPEWLAFAGEQGAVARHAVPARGPVDVEVFPLGAVYFDVEGPVSVSIDGDTGVDWAIVFVEDTKSTIVRGTEGSYSGEGKTTVGIVSLGPPDLDADDEMVAAKASVTITERPCGCGGGGAAGWLVFLAFAFPRRAGSNARSPSRPGRLALVGTEERP
jgi:hypothetical protein